jgi:UDP-N-acetylmuramoyl-L-alanyl-D-glutamate--2,6-diaminopimelate ligase
VIWDAHNFAWNAAWQLPNLALTGCAIMRARLRTRYMDTVRKLWMVGITGTNGKTSCSHWFAQSFSGLGRKTALIGTLGNGFPPALQATLNTTPDAIRVHGLSEYAQQVQRPWRWKCRRTRWSRGG